ncbi:MAG: hypothetical protein ACREDO_07675 [Methyloceanibacter sp.]
MSSNARGARLPVPNWDRPQPLFAHNGDAVPDSNGKESHARAQTVRVSVDSSI